MATTSFREYASSLHITDGAWGTQLHRKGLVPGHAPEEWNQSNPSAVMAVAKSYVDAGSDVILTNTFGANRLGLEPHGLADRAAELAEAGVLISRRVADAAASRPVKVFASMGPTGQVVMMGEVSPQTFLSAFSEQARVMEAGGADAIVLETFNELAELKLALEACKTATSLPVVACLTFASGPNKTCTMMGEKPADLAAAAVAGGADVVGANCGVGPDLYVEVARQLRRGCGLPIWIKANAGLPVFGKDGKTTFPMGPAAFADHLAQLVEAGVSFVGGCCGTTPAHIEALRAKAQTLKL